MGRSIKFWILLVLLLPTTSAAQLMAPCECEPRTEEKNLADADLVFSGVLGQRPELAHSAIWIRFDSIKIVKLEDAAKSLLALYQDGIKPLLLLQPLSRCSFSFEYGKSYLVYANVEQTDYGKPYLSARGCNGTIASP